MGWTRSQLVRWWDDHDEEALARLLACGALYSGTRDLKNVAAAYGEYLACRALGGQRLRQASSEGDCRLPNGRVVEVKTTTSPRGSWPLGYEPTYLDYALVRLALPDWRVVEAWLVPLRVAQRYASGSRWYMPRDGEWQARSRPLPLHRF